MLNDYFDKIVLLELGIDCAVTGGGMKAKRVNH